MCVLKIHTLKSNSLLVLLDLEFTQNGLTSQILVQSMVYSWFLHDFSIFSIPHYMLHLLP